MKLIAGIFLIFCFIGVQDLNEVNALDLLGGGTDGNALGGVLNLVRIIPQLCPLVKALGEILEPLTMIIKQLLGVTQTVCPLLESIKL